MKTRKLLMVSTALVTLTLASPAADAASTYASLFGGANFLSKTHLSGGATVFTTTFAVRSHESLDTSYKTGYVIGGNFGVDWGQFRTELEVAYRENASSSRARFTTHTSFGFVNNNKAYKVRTTTYVSGTHYHFSQPGFNKGSSSTGTVSTRLRAHAYSLMANAWYDFHDLQLPFGLTPYVGGGLGLAEIQMNGSVNGKTILTKNDVVFAWQLGAGASVPIADQTSLFVDYRYFSAVSAGFSIQPGPNTGRVKADFNSHSVLVGIRFNFS